MPVFNNEIINKNYLSSQGAAARNSLMRMMLNNETIEDLGIENHLQKNPFTMFC